MKNGKILIIDDNEDVLFALNLLLEPYVEQIIFFITWFGSGKTDERIRLWTEV